MTRLLIAGITIIALIEGLLVVIGRGASVLTICGVITAVLLGAARAWLADEDLDAEQSAGEPPVALDDWVARTQTLVSWADGTRRDWDKYLRPVLAVEFQMATGQHRSKDAAAFDASGRMLFGDKLWPWVDPHAASYADRAQPAPGREALAEILHRMERT